MSELEAIKELARDAISALNYIEESYGKLYGVGWERLYESAKALLSEEPKSIGTEVSGRKVHLDKEINDTYWEAYHASRIRENKVCHFAALRAVIEKHGCLPPDPTRGELTDQELLTIASGLPICPDDDDIVSVLRAAIAADRFRFHNHAQ